MPGERRGRQRMRALGVAIVQRASGESTALAIRDLSVTGARLVGAIRIGEHELVRLALELDAAPVWVTGQVVRSDVQRSQIAVAFREVSAEARTAIERALAAARDRARSASPTAVLVVHPDADVRSALERDLALLQRAATGCASHLDAMSAIEDPGYQTVIACAESADTHALLLHLAAHAPDTRRVLLFGEHMASIDHGLAANVDAVLRTPWRIRALARALGIDMNDSSIALLPGMLDSD